MSSGPVQDVTFGTAMQISLDSFYQVLKGRLGVSGSNEYLQIKLIADSIDISKDDYPWYSLLNLYVRSDQAIVPTPTTDVVTQTATKLSAVYKEFLDLLVKYVSIANLSPTDQQSVETLQSQMDTLSQQNETWEISDYTNWITFAQATGQSVGDTDAQLNWAQKYGHGSQIQQNQNAISVAFYQMNALLDKQYAEPGDKDIVQAYKDFMNQGMYMGYPIQPDYKYDDQKKFSMEYLATMINSGRFLWRPVIGWDKTLDFMQGQGVGAIAGNFDSSTTTSYSQTTDWGASASVSYAFISVSASVSDHQSIQSDFSHATGIDISSQASYIVNLTFPDWFHPELFQCQRLVENIHDFAAYFGPQGKLLYYPTGLACVRGFKTVFHSSQNWTYDYEHSFSAKAGGGFSVFGIGFGSSGSYSYDQKEHDVSVSDTDLTISDDQSTIRFVGYVLAKNTVFQDAITARSKKALGKVAGTVTRTAKGVEVPKPSSRKTSKVRHG